MNKCINCNIYVADETELCPLCHSVLEETQPEKEENGWWRPGCGYPDIRKWQRKLQFVIRLILFVMILSEAILVMINKWTFDGFWWSGICGIAMLYFYISMVYWLKHDSGPAAKMGLQLTLTILLVVGIDYLTGANGWSLEWVAPGIILLGDAIVFIFMLTNRKQWYSYTLLLLLITIYSIAVIIIYFMGKIDHVILVLISAAVTFTYMLGTLIFGDRAVKRELRRRFHM